MFVQVMVCGLGNIGLVINIEEQLERMAGQTIAFQMNKEYYIIFFINEFYNSILYEKK